MDLETVKAELFNDIFLDLKAKSDNENLTKQQEDLMATLAITIAECYSPIFYKMKKIALIRPEFIPSKVLLSPLAYQRFTTLVKKKVVLNDGLCFGLPYHKSTRISNEVYCRIEGSMPT